MKLYQQISNKIKLYKHEILKRNKSNNLEINLINKHTLRFSTT